MIDGISSYSFLLAWFNSFIQPTTEHELQKIHILMVNKNTNIPYLQENHTFGRTQFL